MRHEAQRRAPVLNVMTVDVEDYFHVSAFAPVVPRDAWAAFDSRVCANTERILAIFEQAGVRATFFVLGWVAERHPDLVRRIAAMGHEIASHSYAHRLVYELSPWEFRVDLRRAKAAIESAAGVAVRGFRAPSFSITPRSRWALDILIEEGYAYDSSIFPIRHDRYGMPGAPRHLHRIARDGGSLWEVPPSTVRLAGLTLPIAGGGYLRLFPYALTKRGISRINRVERRPAVVYVHPWELDPGQPRIAASLPRRWRHYVNLTRTGDRLARLAREFRFGPVSAAIGAQQSAEPATAAAPAPVRHVLAEGAPSC